MIEYTLQLCVQDKDGKMTHISFMDVQAEDARTARELAKERYERDNPGTIVYLHHSTDGVDGSPLTVKKKHIK